MTQDIVVTVVHRDRAGREDMIRLRARENNRAAPGKETEAPRENKSAMSHDVKRRIMEFVLANDTDGAIRDKLKDTSNPAVFQQGGKLILRPLQIKARKIPTSILIGSLPDNLGDSVPPLKFSRDADLSLDVMSESLVCFGIRRSEAQFLALYVSDVVDESEATGKSRAISLSLDTMSVVARVERTGPEDNMHPNQLRILVVAAEAQPAAK
jgi:hypothetical protein